ncbi:uncharacterized protein K460DRAFT_382251 [Cucurbitaria berberidis CBS 394.84]|uniref:Uncharacterized protein n=1 Tax=Cucurbitaria berberidis CBS 394.84 TaxID=1168544 RepID=A0A9P4GQ59_9PLEO|nr:uncharacterized protein K460DRAFT_382251 [Cucurbitaria berberidis CBS 394.84]KAF1850588.1 hypothetical protein K460DRAFT_382251 [Cucurbitaria berberidis CBS 394.84]
MSGILCTWANLPADATEWYENEWVPETCSHGAQHALHCELTPNGMETEPTGTLDSPWGSFIVYEIPKIHKATEDLNKERYRPSDKLLAGPLKDARFDVRTYHEIQRWQAEDWEGDIADIASVAAMEWRVSPEVEEDVVHFYKTVVGPTISSSQDVLRFRFFKIDTATVLQGSSYVTKEKGALYTYFTLVELESDEWPWDAVVDLAENQKWNAYFEQQNTVKWQVSHYLVKKTSTAKAKA